MMVRWILLPFRLVYVVYAYLLFIVLMILVLPWVIPAVMMGTIRGGNLLFRVCRTWSDSWMFLVGIWCKSVKMNVTPVPEKCIYIANHISYLDIPMIFHAVRHPIRILGKVEMASVPLFGTIYKTTAVTVDRSSPAKRAASLRRLRAILRSGISIFIFPEGTFNETGEPLKSFYDGAFKLALEMQIPIQPMVFPDTLNRMHYKSIFAIKPGICRSVYLEPISVEGLTMSDLPAIKQQAFQKMEEALRLLQKSK